MQPLRTECNDLSELLRIAEQSSDFRTIAVASGRRRLLVSYYATMIDEKTLQSGVIDELQRVGAEDGPETPEELISRIPIAEIEWTDRVAEIQTRLLKGCAIIRFDERDPRCALVNVATKDGMRKTNDTENEYSVVGPKVGFVEDLDTNLRLLRTQINVPNLVVKEISIGSMSRTRVAVISVAGVTNPQTLQTVEQRLRDIDFDIVFDSSQLDQIISDNSLTPFPLFVTTERRDRVVYALISGQVAIASDGSPYFVTGPSTLFDFFISPEDYYLPWVLGSFFRLIRIVGVVFSLFASAMYVAIATYHYEVIPRDLLGPLIFSRQNVPFPPVLEVLFLEITIEFLREAGARLPTKIGQTLGIVGGIVIGQAAVEAGLSSNILVIIVAFSALASFATPIYKMSNAIRFLRFPMIALAGLWGSVGLFIGIGFLLVHITRLTSLGAPYTVPIYPLRAKDLEDSLIRSSYQRLNLRPRFLRPLTRLKFRPKPPERTNGEREE